MPHQSASGQHEIGTRVIKSLVDEEIFLLPAEIAFYMLYLIIKITGDTCRRLVDTVERAEQRSLIVERLAGI